MTTAMNFDSSPSSHPISVQVSSPEELSGLFDTISYRKVRFVLFLTGRYDLVCCGALSHVVNAVQQDQATLHTRADSVIMMDLN